MPNRPSLLNARERECVRLVHGGVEPDEIALTLGIPPERVHKIIHGAMRKLGVSRGPIGMQREALDGAPHSDPLEDTLALAPRPFRGDATQIHDLDGGSHSTDDRARARLAMCRALQRERCLIGGNFGFELCSVPAWDMLLDLYRAKQEGRATYLWQCCVAANIPISSAHRKIGQMIVQNLLERTEVVDDRRRIGIRLTESCAQQMDSLMDRLAASS